VTTREDIQRVINQIRIAPGKWQHALTLEATKRIVLRTPVKTGRARGNWQVTSGSPAVGELDRLDPGGTAATEEAAVLDIKYGDASYVVNNLPYIDALEHGSSTQAPEGMVGITVAELQAVADQIARSIEQDGSA
jgi:hypothetical protein